MKKLICFVVTAALLVTSSSLAFAKPMKYQTQDKNRVTQEDNSRIKSQNKNYKYNASPVIKYGKFKLPISPINKGMGATVNFDKATAVLTVVKGTITIVVNFKNETVTVNGVADTDSGIFTAKSSKKMTVLIKYIAKVLGVRVKVGKDTVTVETPGLDLPKNITITPIGTTVIPNTLNSTTLYMNVTADITPGQATGGKAELYVGTKLVATNNVITATGSAIQFTTSDSTPTNDELKVAVPEGGAVTVKLYNSNNDCVVTKSNITLKVDYVAPTLATVTSAIYHAQEGSLYLIVTGASGEKDRIDVTKLSLYDTTLNKYYQLTDTAETGSKGEIKSSTSIKVELGTTDKLGLQGFGTSTMVLTIAAGSLITDVAGNTSPALVVAQTVSVTIIK